MLMNEQARYGVRGYKEDYFDGSAGVSWVWLEYVEVKGAVVGVENLLRGTGMSRSLAKSGSPAGDRLLAATR